MMHDSPPQLRSGLAPGVPDRRRNNPAARAEREAFARILARITRARGFRIGDNTLQRLRAVIWERIMATGAGTAVAYLAQLDDAELAALHDAIAIRETRFFRVPAQFWLLRDDLLPLLWLRRGHDTQLRLWSAGCATGEEVYSLAIVAVEAAMRVGASASPPVRVIGTDINDEALAAAREALYPLHTLGNVPPELRTRYFDRVGEMFAVSPLLRDLTSFQHADLLAPVWPVANSSIDVLFYQNVLRFLPQEAVGRVVERLYAALAPGGYLFLAPGETLPRTRVAFDRVQLPSAAFFQKPL